MNLNDLCISCKFFVALLLIVPHNSAVFEYCNKDQYHFMANQHQSLTNYDVSEGRTTRRRMSCPMLAWMRRRLQGCAHHGYTLSLHSRVCKRRQTSIDGHLAKFQRRPLFVLPYTLSPDRLSFLKSNTIIHHLKSCVLSNGASNTDLSRCLRQAHGSSV